MAFSFLFYLTNAQISLLGGGGGGCYERIMFFSIDKAQISCFLAFFNYFAATNSQK